MAEIDTGVDAVTDFVVIAKVAELAPAAIVTDDGIVTSVGWLVEMATAIPPAGATAVIVTVAVLLLPPATAVGLSVRLDEVGGWSDSKLVFVAPAYEAETAAVVAAVTAVVEIGNVAVSAPAGILTVAGNPVTVELFVASVMVVAALTGRVSLIVPMLLLPPETVDGLSVMDDKMVCDAASSTRNTSVRSPFATAPRVCSQLDINRKYLPSCETTPRPNPQKSLEDVGTLR